MISNPQLTRLLQATTSTLVMVGLWQVASLYFPPYLFRPISCRAPWASS